MALLCAVCHGAWAQEVTYDFTGSDWSVTNGVLTNGTVTINGSGSANFKMNSGYFMLGKNGAYITLPAYDFNVGRIEVVGNSGASTSVVMNVFVDDEAVSTQTTGCTGTNTYEIDSDYQDANTQYTIKVLSAHNAQITKINVYKAQASNEPYVIVSPTTITAGYEGVTDGTLSLTTNMINGYVFVYYEADGVTEAEDQTPSWFEPTLHPADGTISYTIDENDGAERSLYFKVKGHDSSNILNFVYSELITVTQAAYVAPIDPTTIRWSEDFSYDEEPSNYTFNPSNTKLYDDTYAGGEAPELLIYKNGGSFVVNIDLQGYCGSMTLTFKANKNNLTVSATGGTLGTVTEDNGVYTYPITVPEGTETLTLTFSNSTSNNIRVDDFLLVGGEISTKSPANFSFGVEALEINYGQSFDAPELTYADGFDGEITYASSDTSVAEVDQDGNVTIKGEGTTVISATSTGSDTFGSGFASYTLTVNPSNDVVIVEDDKVTMKFDIDGWGIGTTKIVDEKEFAASNDATFKIKLCGTSGNGYRYYNNPGYTLLGKQGAYLQLPAFDFAVGKIEVVGSSGASDAVKQNIFVGDVAVSTETEGAKNVTNTYDIASDYQAAGNIYTLKVTSAHNTQFTKIIVYKAEEPVGESFILSISNKACDSEGTFYATVSALGEGNFIVPEDAEVSTITIDNGQITRTSSFGAGDVISGEEAYLVEATRSGDFEFAPTTDEAGQPGENWLYPAIAGEKITAPDPALTYRFYKLSLNKNSADYSVGFYYGDANGAPFTFTSPNKAYLAVPQGNTSDTQTTDVIPFDDKTGIDVVTSEAKTAEGIFTLTGVRIDSNKLQKGVYIVNGKKQIIK